MNAQLIDAIYQRHCNGLALVNCDTGPARMALWLALTELAERLPVPPPVPSATDDSSSTATAVSGMQIDRAAEPGAVPAPPLDEQPQRRRMGRPPGSGRKPAGPSIDEIAAQLEAAAAAVAMNPDFIAGDDEGQPLTGILRREETVVRSVNGQPLRTTRQHIELR